MRVIGAPVDGPRGAYTERTAADGVEGRLVSQHTFSSDWDHWEMHPHGHEVVICTQGSFVLHQEQADGSRSRMTLTAGSFAIHAPGVWHTADATEPATAIFITAGVGTERRAR